MQNKAIPHSPAEQVALLDSNECSLPRFHERLASEGVSQLQADGIEILQLNIGYRCNLRCTHCHVNGSPERHELMSREVMEQCLVALDKSNATTVDITGGAPEMNPHFRWFIGELRATKPDARILVRTNLTLLTDNKTYSDIPELLKAHRIALIASLPCTTKKTVDAVRGDGVFDRSIAALKLLNSIGYGTSDSALELNLVFNPSGAFLPEAQQQLEHHYRTELQNKYGITFSHLFTITNMPVSRFLENLCTNGTYCDYMKLLVDSFNPTSVKNVMCRTTLSVGWDGTLYDCDFNQMLRLPVECSVPQHINAFDAEVLSKRHIVTNQHCYGCTAGAGSSCQGCLV
uniref:Uncharacterized protein n=1 Tax=Chlorobium chlorochromatii (strain CaD3) TaxID=340177 RepID=Q3AQ79_CHLCH